MRKSARGTFSDSYMYNDFLMSVIVGGFGWGLVERSFPAKKIDRKPDTKESEVQLIF